MDLHSTMEKVEVIILSSSSEDGESSCESIVVLSDSEDEDCSQDIIMESEFSEESSSESDSDVIIVGETDLVWPQENQVEKESMLPPKLDCIVQTAEENLVPLKAECNVQEDHIHNEEKNFVLLQPVCEVQEYQDDEEYLVPPKPATDVQGNQAAEERLVPPEPDVQEDHFDEDHLVLQKPDCDVKGDNFNTKTLASPSALLKYIKSTELTRDVLDVSSRKTITIEEELNKGIKDDCVTSDEEEVEEIVKKIVDSRKNCDMAVDSDIDTAAWHHFQPPKIGVDKLDNVIQACNRRKVMKSSKSNSLKKAMKLGPNKNVDSAWKAFCLNSAKRSMSATRRGTSGIKEKIITKTRKKSCLVDKFKKEKCPKSVQETQVEEKSVCKKVKLLLAVSNSKSMSSSFKIPKEKEPYFPVEVKVALSTGDKRVDKILAEFDSMYDRTEKVFTGSSKCKLKPANEEEKDDIQNKGWEEERSLKTNEDRKKFAQTKFGNPVASNPARNLTVQGFRAASKRTVDGCKKVEDPFYALVDKNSSNKIQYQDFTLEMKQVFAVKFKNILGKTKNMVEEKSAIKDFQSYIRHYKSAQEETQNFLEYYNMKDLPEMVTQEVTDIENQFSTFQGYYGQPDTFPCKPCGRSHQFCQ